MLKASRNGSGMKVHKFAMGGKLIKHGKLGSFCSHQFQTLRRIILPVCKAERKTFILRSSYYIFCILVSTNYYKRLFSFFIGQLLAQAKINTSHDIKIVSFTDGYTVLNDFSMIEKNAGFFI